MKKSFKEFLYHFLLRLILAVYILMGIYFYLGESPPKENVDRGTVLLLWTYLTEALIFIAFPFTVFNCLGFVLLNPFRVPDKQPIGLNLPFICFRVVTKGFYPKLVKDNTRQNIELCRKLGLKSFKFEIVTDNGLNIEKGQDICETIVPENYQTKNGSLYKARALQYCLEPSVNVLSNEDWVVHLDEETKLTDDVIYGIIDFMKSQADVGQGVIVYAAENIENWLTTLADGLRVAFDYGMMRLCFEMFKRPMMGFKGSFIISKVSAEMDIGFDFGPQESIAEDLRFALTAWTKGYKFDFVYGVMLEKSTFGVLDFIKQRKRWFIGHFHILWGNTLPLYCKFFLLILNMLNLFLCIHAANRVIGMIWPMTLHMPTLFLVNVLVPCIMFMFMFGNFMSLRGRRFSLGTKILICLLSQMMMPVTAVLEATASFWGFLTRNRLSFHIVQKEIDSPLTEVV